jgi:hypothetical protein
MCETLHTGLRLLVLGDKPGVDTRPSIGIHGGIGVHRLIAEPTAPAIAFAHLIEITHNVRLWGLSTMP